MEIKEKCPGKPCFEKSLTSLEYIREVLESQKKFDLLRKIDEMIKELDEKSSFN